MKKYSDFTVNHFKDTLKEYREKKGMTQTDLARVTGMTSASISAYEKGLRDPKCEIYCKLAKALDIDPIIFFATEPTVDVLLANGRYLSAMKELPELTEREKTLSQLQECLETLDAEDLESVTHIVNQMSKLKKAERRINEIFL